MNQFMEQKWSWLEGSHAMRTGLLDVLTDADLKFTPGGDAMPLGALIREMGEIEHSYIQSLKTATQNWDYRNTEAGLADSVEKLKAWFQTLDDELKTLVSGFSDEDLKKTVERNGYPMPFEMQLEVYLQALLIFFGKASIYLKAMGKPLPPNIKEWIW